MVAAGVLLRSGGATRLVLASRSGRLAPQGQGDAVMVEPTVAAPADCWWAEAGSGQQGFVPRSILDPLTSDEKKKMLQKEAEKVEREEKERLQTAARAAAAAAKLAKQAAKRKEEEAKKRAEAEADAERRAAIEAEIEVMPASVAFLTHTSFPLRS